MKRRTPLRNRPAADKAPTVRQQLDAALAELKGRAAAVGAVDDTPPSPAAVALAADAVVFIPGFPRAAPIKSLTWLRLVRTMPCSLPDCPSRPGIAWKGTAKPPHLPWYDALARNVAQCDPNHHPSKGASGGGSDLETHPACRPCHERITLHQIPHELLGELVADTLLQVVKALRDGRLPREVLAQVAAEVLAG